MQTFIGQKLLQSQAFLEDGTRIPVTKIKAPALPVVAIKTKDKDGYIALQVGWGEKKHTNKADLGHIRGAKLEKAPRFLREIRLKDKDNEVTLNVGDSIKAIDVLKPGDIIDVIGLSKGKGYAGVVKRYHFKGGPRTHGQSDRERAPGSIGQTTTPGRVYKGKHMSGRMGQDRVTIKNLEVIEVIDGEILLKGVVPGVMGGLVIIEKVGEKKKFIPLYKEVVEEVKEPAPTPNVAEAKEVENQEIKAEAVEETSVKEEKEENKEEQKDASK